MPDRARACALDALARAVAPLVLAHLARALGAVEAPHYSTRKGYAPPEYVGRAKAWRKAAPTIPGAVRLGRWWSVAPAAYASWLASQATAPAATAASPPANDPPAPWSPRAALVAVGARGTR